MNIFKKKYRQLTRRKKYLAGEDIIMVYSSGRKKVVYINTSVRFNNVNGSESFDTWWKAIKKYYKSCDIKMEKINIEKTIKPTSMLSMEEKMDIIKNRNKK